jgi:putative sterol carrier protein
MTGTADAFFRGLAERRYEPLLHSVSGTIKWDIQGAGSWFIVVNNGSLTVNRDMASADCVMACSEEDFDRMVVGKQNPITLYLQGKMKITGNVGLAQMFQRLFPDQRLASERAATAERR